MDEIKKQRVFGVAEMSGTRWYMIRGPLDLVR